MKLLELRGIQAHYGRIQALHDLQLEVHEGEIVSLIGANGAGKTTTLMTISGCVRASAGTIHYAGQDIGQLAPESIVRLGIAHSPEGRKIFTRLSVQDNLELGAFIRRDKEGIQRDLKRIYELFPILGQRRAQAGGTLSGGEQQMLAVGRAMMSRPRLLLLDEPSLGLAPLIILDLFQVIRQLNDEGTTILLVEQNARMALKHSDRAYVLETGKILTEGPASELLSDARISEAYLGSGAG